MGWVWNRGVQTCILPMKPTELKQLIWFDLVMLFKKQKSLIQLTDLVNFHLIRTKLNRIYSHVFFFFFFLTSIYSHVIATHHSFRPRHPILVTSTWYDFTKLEFFSQSWNFFLFSQLSLCMCLMLNPKRKLYEPPPLTNDHHRLSPLSEHHSLTIVISTT